MKTDKRSEMQFEELLRQAMQEDHANELERIPSEEELEGKVVFSKRHQRRMQRLFNGDSAVLEGSTRGTLGTRRLIKILIASALLIGAVVLGMMVYSYYNPVSAFFPIMEDLKSISGGAPIRDGSLELSFTENIKVFSSIEELENELHTGAMYPRAGEDEALSAVQVRYAEFPDKKVCDIRATIIVDRPGQKGIIIGKNGAMLKQIGSEARKELEEKFGYKVFLQLWVKVKPGWRKSPEELRRLGYNS